jgi:flagellar basal-body rod modification protein FlgD
VNLNSIVQQLQAQQQANSSGVTANAVSAKTTAASTSSSSSAADDSNTTITADDFITLLVTELQNQDPTADTDPNSYVNQLINVNSLQQLISINQGVGSLETGLSTSTDVLAAIDENVSALDPSSTSSSAAASAVPSASNTNAIAHATSSAQLANAQAGYSAFAATPAAQGQSSSAPVVPSEWRTKTNALP